MNTTNNPKIETKLSITINNNLVVNTVIHGTENNFLRNYVIYSLYTQQLREGTPSMEIYLNIEGYMKETLNISVSEERIRKIVNNIRNKTGNIGNDLIWLLSYNLLYFSIF